MTWHQARNPDRNSARKVTVLGKVCDSRMEGDRWLQLSMMAKAGEVKHLKHHPRFPLTISQPPYMPVTVAVYEGDAEYYLPDGTRVVEDTKGRRPEPGDKARGKKAVSGGPAWAMFRLKIKLVKALYGIEVQVWPPMAEKKSRRKK